MANGTTSYDRTNYFEVVPSTELPTALWLESDRMGFLLDTLDAKKLDVQRDVVSNERRQRYENRPYGSARAARCATSSARSRTPITTASSAPSPRSRRASVDDLKDFFHRYYAPNNASLAIVGDFDPAQVKALVEQYFGPIPARPAGCEAQPAHSHHSPACCTNGVDPVARVPRLDHRVDGREALSPRTKPPATCWRASSGREGARASTGRWSRQAARLRRRGRATRRLGLGGTFDVSVMPREGHTVAEMRPIVEGISTTRAPKGVTAEETDRAVRNIVAGKLRGIDASGLRRQGGLLNDYEMWTGDPGFLQRTSRATGR